MGEQANLAWSLVVLRSYSDDALELFRHVYSATDAKALLSPPHAHQLWQALFVLEHDRPAAVVVPSELRRRLQSIWRDEKNRRKVSSSRHRALSQTLSFMKVAH